MWSQDFDFFASINGHEFLEMSTALCDISYWFLYFPYILILKISEFCFIRKCLRLKLTQHQPQYDGGPLNPNIDVAGQPFVGE